MDEGDIPPDVRITTPMSRVWLGVLIAADVGIVAAAFWHHTIAAVVLAALVAMCIAGWSLLLPAAFFLGNLWDPFAAKPKNPRSSHKKEEEWEPWRMTGT